jgi:hypothetical protein
VRILWLFDTCGSIVGPAILGAGLLALALCLRASRPASSPKARRAAVAVALLPAAFGPLGALFGLIVRRLYPVPGDHWSALGKVCLAGLVVAAVPLAWSLLLARARRGPDGRLPVG